MTGLGLSHSGLAWRFTTSRLDETGAAPRPVPITEVEAAPVSRPQRASMIPFSVAEGRMAASVNVVSGW